MVFFTIRSRLADRCLRVTLVVALSSMDGVFSAEQGKCGENKTMRLPRFQFTVRRLIIAVVMATIAAVAGSVLNAWTRERVTLANFGKIEVGMAESQVREILGRGPAYRNIELGLVTDPGNYSENSTLNFYELKRRGYRDYQRAQWNSDEITICVIFEMSGRVVCRYSGEGQPRVNWSDYFVAIIRRQLAKLL